MPRFFGKYPAGTFDRGQGRPVQTAQEAYDEGFRVGMTWDPVKHPWVPGGPMSFTARDYERDQAKMDPDKADWVAYCDASRENHTMWMAGFHEGRFAADPDYKRPA